MGEINFGKKASIYETFGLVQKLNADILLDLAGISGQGNVLDLGCGPGGVTAKIAGLTSGRVVGVDISSEMIEKAKGSYGNINNLEYQVLDASQLGFIDEFDFIFCNSAFQWFLNPERVLQECWQTLRKGASMSIQAPATSQYCPAFIMAMVEVRDHPDTADIFNHFQSPFLLLESQEEYAELFSKVGFEVEYCEFRDESNRFSVEQVLNIYKSGAENGYLNQAYYDVIVDDTYIDTCRQIIKTSMQRMADREGMIHLKFKRIYLKARKP